MLDPEKFTNEISPNLNRLIGNGCLIIGGALGLSAWIMDNSTIIIIAFVAGLPITLVGLSLLFEKAKHGNGIFSAVTLYVIGILLIIAALVGLYSGESKSGGGIIFCLGCITLARKRKRQNLK